MTAELARVGGPVGALGLGLLLVATRREARLAGLAAWALGLAALAVHLAPHGHHRALGAIALVGLLLAAAGAALLRRWPWLLAVAALATAPARFPVSVGSTQANLLVPLYGVVAAAALALAWELLRGDERSRELGPLALPLAAFVGWTGISLAWTTDLRQGSIDLLFFFLPFGLLAVMLARLPWSRRGLLVLYGELGAMALAFAAIGIYQWLTRDVFWNPKVIVSNAYAPFYRVNSVFYDPSIYGRFLVVAIVAALPLVLRGGPSRVTAPTCAGIAGTWVGLLFSFSQSSFAALIAGTLALSTYVWRWRALVVAGLVGAVILSVGFSAPQVRHNLIGRSNVGLNKASSGRLKLVSNGVEIALDNAAAGVGVGSFRRAYGERLHLRGREPKSAVSHDTPVTVAAEGGVLGLGLFAWLVAVALLTPFRRVGATFAGRSVLVFGLGLAVIVVHSLFYNALFEDPMFWGLLGLAALGAGVARREVG